MQAMPAMLKEREENGALRLGPETGRPQQRLLQGYLHKTSNALCGIKGYASLIAGLGDKAEDNARWARRIINEVEKMERLFLSVDELARPARRTLGMEDPRLMVEVAVREALARHPRFAVELEDMPAGRLLLPGADFGMVLRDVLDNAAEGADGNAGPVRAELTWSRGANGRLRIVLKDTAGGIPPQLGAQVREPFVSGKLGHVGIGLTRVETVMDLHGLAWTLASDYGTGTTVTMEVAAAARSATQAGKADDGA